LIAVAEVGPDAAVLAFEHVPGRTFASVGHSLGDAELAGAWEIVRDLQSARIAHRTLTAENFLQANDGKVYIQGIDDGIVAASDVLLRIDLAEALVTLSISADPVRAIQAGRDLAIRLGATNVHLDVGDIAALRDLGQFDYVICHGVYSWVPAHVRERILSLCAEVLAPEGLAYISYNTFCNQCWCFCYTIWK
jgi:SAM-dependent methyltransferase